MMAKVTERIPDERVDAGRHSVQIYHNNDGSKTVTVGNNTGRKDGGNYGGKGTIKKNN